MVAPLYVSGLLLRVIRTCVKACIDVTLYAELFITSIIEKHVLIYSKDNFDRCPMIHSWIILVTLDWLMARHTSGAVHSIAYYRAYVWSIGDDFRPFSLFFRGRAFTLLHTLQLRQELLLWMIHLEHLQDHVKVCAYLKVLLSVLIYPYRPWFSMFK